MTDVSLNCISFLNDNIDATAVNQSGNLYVDFSDLSENSIYHLTANLPGLASNLAFGSCLVHVGGSPTVRGIVSVVTISSNAAISFNRILDTGSRYVCIVDTVHSGTAFNISVIKKI